MNAISHRWAPPLLAGALLVATVACGRTHLWPGPDNRHDTGADAGGGIGPGGGGVGPGGGGVGPGGGGVGPGGGGVGPGGGGTGPGGGGTGGTGATGPCTTAWDCDDLDWCTTDECVAGSCQHVLKDSDADSYVDEVCGGSDCNDLNPNVNPGLGETCTDAADNDCNGVADCFDPACASAPACGCKPAPGGEKCSNGVDDDCDTTVDCNDSDCIGTPACGCAPNEKGLCVDGIDNDCDKHTDCDDTDCASDKSCICQATPELCSNKKDDDCDLLVDCADPNCAGAQECLCQPPGSPEVCNDKVDNDCDTLVDCADPNCAASPACKTCKPEVCSDGIDNDCDNLIDCADDACFFAPNCAATPEVCNNQLDDDHDTLTDCADPDCANNPLCVVKQGNCLTAKLISASGTFTGDTTGLVGEHIGACGGGAGEAVFYFVLSQPSRVHLDSKYTSFDSVLYVRFGSCEEGPEIACDDSGGYKWSAAIEFNILYPGKYYVFLDGFTIHPIMGANEGPFQLNVEIEPNPTESSPARCSDGLDNDGDVYVDCADPGCKTVGACLNCLKGGPPSAEFGVAKCTNLLDDDCDGKTDALDKDCDASPYAASLEDCTGTDQNDNGIPDDFSCRCAITAECMPGEVCYTHTIHACGPPCYDFFGNVCPAIATGTACSQSTGQCEF